MDKKKYLKSFVVSFILSLAFFAPLAARAAELNFTPSAVSQTVDNTFSIAVYVASVDQAVNAVSGVVSFPTDKLKVVNLSKINSILSLWVQEPAFSNTQGTINFEGITLNPGYVGSGGTIITITFQAKTPGQANIRLASGSILANNGVGTNILNKLGTAVFSIQSKISEVSEVVSPATVPSDNLVSIITSTTHPNQSKWYANNLPEFSWSLPPEALEVRTLIGKSATGVPVVRYVSPISTKQVNALSDGTHYFSLQIRTAKGWGKIERYRVNIDTTPPKSFSVVFPHGKKSLEPRPIILFNTTDGESNVSHYTIKIGDGGAERISPETESNPYSLPPQYPGAHIVSVTAVDEAGNTQSASEAFEIEAIETPNITYYQDELKSGDILKISGTTYSDSEIVVLIKEKGEIFSEEHTRSNSFGAWTLISTKRFNPGVYSFTARATDERGAKSNETTPLTIIVHSKFLVEFINLILNYLSATLLVLLALVLVIGGGAYIWYRLIHIIRRLRRESHEAETTLAESFKVLRQDINEHVARLKTAKSKRELTFEEMAFLRQFDKELTEAETLISKGLKDISNS